MIRLPSFLWLSSTCLLCHSVVAFVPRCTFVASPSVSGRVLDTRLHALSSEDDAAASRREFFQETAVTSLGLGTLLSLTSPRLASASGGATAGGAYLLSAKQRYNQRVSSGVKAFLSLSKSLEGGSLNEATSFFSGDDEGTWKDLSTAGYLLANAFRTNSTTPPDRLPSVQKWKAFEAEIINLQKAVKKKASKGSLAAYQQAKEALDAYLEGVELPPSAEMK